MTPTQRYEQDLAEQVLQRDESQRQLVAHLQRVYDDLVPHRQKQGFFQSLFQARTPVRGIYIWGSTGRGKTYLVDRFYACLPFDEKNRVHFHKFMLDIHGRLQRLPKSPDPLPIIARQLAREYRILCLDEFHVHDIGDAMIMAGLLKALFALGVTLITTSNTAIKDLYRGGLQRDHFLPAIALLQQHCEEVHLGDGLDYRYQALENNGTYCVCHGNEGDIFLEQQLAAIAPCTPKRNRTLLINDREIPYIAMADDVIWFDFDALCNSPRSSRDYIQISELFHTLLIRDVRRLGEEQDNVARRFIHLVDALYEHNVKILISAEALPQQLYTGRSLASSFERTVSRLVEMDSAKYLARTHAQRVMQ